MNNYLSLARLASSISCLGYQRLLARLIEKSFYISVALRLSFVTDWGLMVVHWRNFGFCRVLLAMVVIYFGVNMLSFSRDLVL